MLSGGIVVTFFNPVVTDELVIGTLRPAARSLMAFAGKFAHGGWNGDIAQYG